MKKSNMKVLAALSLAVINSTLSAQPPASQGVPVTIDNYNRAQTDVNFAGVVKNGGFGKFRHGRDLAPPASRESSGPTATRCIRFAIVDLDAGPVTINCRIPARASWECRWLTKINTPRATITSRGLIPDRTMIGTVMPSP